MNGEVIEFSVYIDVELSGLHQKLYNTKKEIPKSFLQDLFKQ